MKENSNRKKNASLEPSHALDSFLHPYLFVLREGQTFQENSLDYSLLLLQVGDAAILHSPHRIPKISTPYIQLLKK